MKGYYLSCQGFSANRGKGYYLKVNYKSGQGLQISFLLCTSGQGLLQIGEAFCYYKSGQGLLQIGAAFCYYKSGQG